jgi:hypothetical protein
VVAVVAAGTSTVDIVIGCPNTVDIVIGCPNTVAIEVDAAIQKVGYTPCGI